MSKATLLENNDDTDNQTIKTQLLVWHTESSQDYDEIAESLDEDNKISQDDYEIVQQYLVVNQFRNDKEFRIYVHGITDILDAGDLFCEYRLFLDDELSDMIE